MSDTGENTGADGIRDEGAGTAAAAAAANASQASDEVREEVKLDLDEASIEDYEAVRGDYATDPDSDMTRPAMIEQEDSTSEASGGASAVETGDAAGGAGDVDNAELVEQEDVDQEEDDWSPRRDEEE